MNRRFASTRREHAWKLARELDVDYALVIFFGGMVGYARAMNINKFLWMVRISGGLFPEIREAGQSSTLTLHSPTNTRK